MSVIGTPLETSLLQTAQAQQTASKARDRERAAATDRAQRFRDRVELRVAGAELIDAIRRLPRNESEQAQTEHEAHDQDAAARPHIDVRA